MFLFVIGQPSPFNCTLPRSSATTTHPGIFHIHLALSHDCLSEPLVPGFEFSQACRTQQPLGRELRLPNHLISVA